ncbi:hypothetical protein TIFTF001_034119 [Ficus carica]|uniref:Uncharacterized protein n=1 Tax=Ficus carica TaxID=3494 RepID=A0AA88DZS6_FICCA|nr:hypothetical protein TIFTF001_034119 [Ficus carica]
MASGKGALVAGVEGRGKQGSLSASRRGALIANIRGDADEPSLASFFTFQEKKKLEKSSEVLKIFPTTAREEEEDLELGTNLPELGVVDHRSTRTITDHRTTKSEKKRHADHHSNCQPSLNGEFERFAKVAILFAIFSGGVFGGDKANSEV